MGKLVVPHEKAQWLAGANDRGSKRRRSWSGGADGMVARGYQYSCRMGQHLSRLTVRLEERQPSGWRTSGGKTDRAASSVTANSIAGGKAGDLTPGPRG